MDQGPLVTEQMAAGLKLARDFAAWTPLRAVFWLKENALRGWYLHLVSDLIDDTNFDLAYGEVARLTIAEPSEWLDPFQVKVAGSHKPVSKAVIEIQQAHPNRRPIRLRTLKLGDLYVEEVYIYPPLDPADSSATTGRVASMSNHSSAAPA